MLALVTDDYEMPLGLKEFEDIINEKPNQPLAFVPLSEEEEVCYLEMFNKLFHPGLYFIFALCQC